MRILMTGSHGFVGTNLIQSLSSEHEIIRWDVRQDLPLPEVDAVIHLAGKAHDTQHTTEAEEYFRVNTELTKKIYNRFLESTAKKFIFFSSIKAQDGDTPYAQSKRAAEEYLIKNLELREKKEALILRPCMIYGKGMKGNLPLLLKVMKTGIPWPLAAFENQRSYASIDNVSFIVSALLTKYVESGIYNVCDDETVSTNELIRIICDSLGKPARLWRIPRCMMFFCAKVGDFLHLPLNSERLDKLTENYVVDNAPLKQVLGITNMPVRAVKGLKSTIQNMIANTQRLMVVLVICLMCANVSANDDPKLDGSVMSSAETVIGNRWVGYDLGQPYVISRVGLALQKDEGQEMLEPLGIFEGANREDFTDALPLYMVAHPKETTDMAYYDISHSKGFRYVRYVAPAGFRSHISGLECYGIPGEGDDSRLYQITNLPTVSIHTLDAEEPYDKEHQIRCWISIVSAGHSDILSQQGTIRIRGNGSSEYPKLPYRIKFEEKQRVLDAPAKAKKWTLINNYGDKTLMRNLLAFEISKKMGMPYTPYGTLVDVMLNGEYKGNYQLCDQVQVHKGRIEVTTMTPDDNEEPALTGGYHFEVDAYARFENSWFQSADGMPVTIHTPDEKSITSSQRSYIESYFNTMEHHWRQYLDLNTFIRHFLVGELAGSTDTYWSVHMYKDRDNDTTYVGPCWDFDLAFENDNRTYPINDKTDFIFRNGGSCAAGMKDFVSSIIDDEDVRHKMKDIWWEVRNEGLNETFMFNLIDSLKSELKTSQAYNFIRWPILGVQVEKEPVIWNSFDEEVESVRQFLKNRFVWMDQILSYNSTPDDLSEVFDEAQLVQIYSVSGIYYGNDLQSMKPGIYILKQGKSRKKVIKK